MPSTTRIKRRATDRVKMGFGYDARLYDGFYDARGRQRPRARRNFTSVHFDAAFPARALREIESGRASKRVVAERG